MTYSIIGILATIILIIINRDVLWADDDRERSYTRRTYRHFLQGVLGYYITDMLWGVLESNHLMSVLYADTVIHFVVMALAVMLWTRYVVAYLEDTSFFGTMLYRAGTLFLGFEVAVVAFNFVQPILFWFDAAGSYHAGPARYLTLVLQILMFFLSSVYTLRVTARTQGTTRRRNSTVGLFGLVMICLIGVQVAYPLLPCYAMGYMLGTCLLHTYVMEDEKDEYRHELEESLKRERRQREELHESREALKDALATAEEVNKAKTAFLSNMSHEIRTPMNAIIGLDSIVLADPTISDATRQNLQMIDTSAHHLLGIINDILDMSRIESGHMVVKQEEFSLGNLLEQVNAIIGGQCDDKGLSYECRVPSDLCDYCVGDEQKLRQALINVLGNAVKFTPAGGSVTMDVAMTMRYEGRCTLRFAIADTGIGMSAEYLPRIFDAFSQEDSSSVNTYGSTGLGMPITKSLVELMGGTIEVQSQKGVGTTFTITLTLTESMRSEEGGGPADEPGSECAEQTDGLAGRRVLIAEDVDINAEIIEMLLDMRGAQTERAENGRIAVEKFSEHEAGYYDAILMDMRMPEMDGLDATRAIRALDRPDALEIPIIALTANAFDEDVRRSMQAGLNAHLSKPVEPDVLYQTLEDLIRR